MRCLILQGGGVLGAMQASAINDHIEREGKDYDVIGGVSVGALNAAVLASCDRGSKALEERSRRLVEMWESDIKGNHSVYRRRFLGPLAAYFKKSLYVTKPLKDLLGRFVDVELIRRSGRKVFVGAVNAGTRSYVEKDETESFFLKWVQASASFPIFLNPIEIDGQEYVDGGLRNNFPHQFLKGFKFTEIDIFMTAPPRHAAGLGTDAKGVSNIVDVVRLVVETLTGEVVWGDLFPFLNYLFELEGECKICLHYPSKAVDVDVLNFSPSLIKELVARGHGYVSSEIHEVFSW